MLGSAPDQNDYDAYGDGIELSWINDHQRAALEEAEQMVAAIGNRGDEALLRWLAPGDEVREDWDEFILDLHGAGPKAPNKPQQERGEQTP